MAKALKQSMRAILPVWKTTPIPALHRESGIPPVPQLLEATRIRFSARLKSLDEKHPLVTRTNTQPTHTIHKAVKRKYQKQPVIFPTRLRRTNQLLACCPRPTLIERRFPETGPGSLQSAPNDKSAREFRRWLELTSRHTLIVYSDGSLMEGAAGYGFVIHQNNQSVCSGSGRLGMAEVFDAEAVGALEGLKAALKRPQATTQKVVVCLDNLTTATCLQGMLSESSQDAFLEFQSLAASHGNAKVRWISGHCNIPGNEQADILAKAGSKLPEPPNALPTLAYLRRTARQQLRDAFNVWWTTAVPEVYKPLNLKATISYPPELQLSRQILHHLLAARSHHGDFAEYHERFNHADAQIMCSCGRRKAPDHIFYCRRLPPCCRVRLTPSPTAAVNRTIGKDFDKYIEAAKVFFEKICPPRY